MLGPLGIRSAFQPAPLDRPPFREVSIDLRIPGKCVYRCKTPDGVVKSGHQGGKLPL